MKLALYQPDIAQNLGAAMRLCACFNVELHVIEPCGFPLSAKALRRTAMDYGSLETLIRHSSWEMFEKSESVHGARLVLFSTKAAKSLSKFTFKPNDILLFGRESAGVPRAVHERAEERVFIPITAQTRSLNLVSSASIAVFAGLRQVGGLP